MVLTQMTAQSPRTIRALLTDATVGPFFAGMLALSCGLWTFSVTAAVVVFAVTGSSVAVGLVTGVQFAAPLLLSVWSGRRADSADRLSQVLFGQFLGAIALMGIVAWAALVGLETASTFYAFLFSAALMGIGFCISAPALQALVPNLVMPTELYSAVTIQQATFNLGRAVGPGVAAVVFATLGSATALVFTLGCYLVFIGTLIRVRNRAHLARRHFAEQAPPGALGRVLGDRTLRVHLAGVVVVGFVSDPVITLGPAIGLRIGMGDAWVGALAGTFGLGAVLILLPAASLRRRVGLMGATRLGLAMLASAMSMLAIWPEPFSALGLAMVAGAGFLLALSSLTTAIQQRAQENQRGVTMALWTMAFLGSRPISALFNGTVAEQTSTTVAMLLLGVLGGGVCFLLRRRYEPGYVEDN